MSKTVRFVFIIYKMYSVVPERVQRTIVHEHVHILGERELNVLCFRLMNAIVERVHSDVHERRSSARSLVRSAVFCPRVFLFIHISHYAPNNTRSCRRPRES